MTSVERVSCVVLNNAYEPVTVVPGKRGLLLCYKGQATILEEHPTVALHSARDIWPVPVQIVLKKYVRARSTFRSPAQLNPNNLFLRDKYTCQYCNRHRSQLKSNEKLTKDHIIPQDSGGVDSWLNLVTACSSCNNKKANKSLEESGFTLPKKPHVPTVFELMSKKVTKSLNKK